MKTIILILVITICSCICTITNKDANSCINALTIPKKVEFAFTHGVACNQFHNNLVDVSQQNSVVSIDNWNACKGPLVQHFTDDEEVQFFKAVDACVGAEEKKLRTQISITNKDANSCVNNLTIPKKVEFAFTHGVACNQFHNNLVDAAQQNSVVSIENWNACKGPLVQHFTDDEDVQFFNAVDACVGEGKSLFEMIMSFLKF